MSKNQEPIKSKAPKENLQLRRITGGCHCGAVQFEAMADSQSVILDCNCSICHMTAYQHLIIKHTDFKLVSGKDTLTEYVFNTGQAKHLFCRFCGIKSFYQPRSHPDSWSINTRCINEFNRHQWYIKSFDGQNWQQSKDQLNS